MSMIKVSSLPSLNGAAVRSAWQRSSQAQARESGQSRRRSLDTPRPRSRASSSHDLASLEMESGGGEVGGVPFPMRPITPPLPSMELFPLVESPLSFTAADALAHMAKLSASLQLSTSPLSSPTSVTPGHAWTPAPGSIPSSSATPACPITTSPAATAHGASVAPIVAAAPIPTVGFAPKTPATLPGSMPAIAAKPEQSVPKPAAAESTVVVAASAGPVEELVASKVVVSEAAKETKPKRVKGKRAGPASRPGPDEVRMYRGTINLDYVQELLGNISHVQRMFRGVRSAPSSTAAAAAMAAARLLSRSLSRAAARVKGSVKDPVAVRLPEEAMAMLTEFGWVDVVTEDPEQAKLMGCLDAEVHNVVTGRVTAWQRPAPDKTWFQIGEASLTGTLAPRPTVSALCASVSAPVSPAASRAASLGGDAALGSLSDPENVDVVETDVMRARAVAGSGKAERVSLHPRVGGRGALTLAALADQLSAAGQQILSAAELMQDWVEEQKEVMGAAIMGGGRPAAVVI